MHVAAGAEIAAGAGDNHVLDAVGVSEVAEGVAQLGIGLERQRIFPFRPVQRDRRHLAVDLPQEMLRLEVGKIHSGGAEARRGVAARRGGSCPCDRSYSYPFSINK